MSMFFGQLAGLAGLGGGGGSSSSSATAGPATNNSVNILGAADGSIMGLQRLLSLGGGSPANGGLFGGFNTQNYAGLEVKAGIGAGPIVLVAGVAVVALLLFMKG